MTTAPEVDVAATAASETLKILGLYKAEWLNGQLFNLFNEPQYFGELKTPRPCVLIGGRGTGKTTVLRGLSYQGQYALGGAESNIRQWKFYGLYYRVNTNRVTAFKGPELPEERWAKYFGHYLNLVFCLQLMQFIEWYCKTAHVDYSMSDQEIRRVCSSLGLPTKKRWQDLLGAIEDAITEFEYQLNSLDEEDKPKLSMQGAPVDELTKALAASDEFKNKQFYFIIDEFENFEDYQQRVLNTLIKHASKAYTFKVGVRELGWRQRATLNANEQLTSPADYAHIDISAVMRRSKFASFAEKIINTRIASAFPNGNAKIDVRDLLPRLSETEEAEQAIDESETQDLLNYLQGQLEQQNFLRVASLSPPLIHFAKYWCESRNEISELPRAVVAIEKGDKIWKDRINNHFHAFLFTLKKGKSGIRKFYAGWDVFIQLANGNIRYLLELVHAAFSRSIEDDEDPFKPIKPYIQTIAAQSVGKKNLSELEGLSVDGAKLTKLLLSLGRVFQLLASDPVGRAPEITQFYIRESGDPVVDRKVSELLNSAVMHLALVREPGSKLTDQSDTRDYDYMIHPVFSPFFVFSHRRKRKFQLNCRQILALVDHPRSSIAEIVGSARLLDEEPLPDQMKLFGSFYG